MQTTQVDLPAEDYQLAAWITDDLWALTYPISIDNRPGIILEKLLILNIVTGKSYEAPLQIPDWCEGGHLLRLRRLRDRQAGLVLECYFAKPGKRFEGAIIVWDVATQTQTLLHHYPPGFGASDFAFAPDLSQGLQERSGDGLSNLLYQVDAQGELQQLLPEYHRVGSPDWSADGRQIAYAVTQKKPDERSSLYTGLVALDNELNQPWRIVVANPDRSDAQVVLERVLGVRALRWSPDSRYLAFNARNYQGWPGIFVIDMTTFAITQVWAEDTDFEWSPNGESMVIMLDDEQNERSFPVILDVSDLP